MITQTATFLGANGEEPMVVVQQLLDAMDPTVGDCLLLGQICRAEIRTRTFQGVDVNGAPFAGYENSRPYYLYPNGEVGNARTGSVAVKAARATAAKTRFAKLGGKRGSGARTAYGIRYDSYAAAKAAHGSGVVDLFGMQQHPHMLDGIIVKAGGREIDQTADAIFMLDTEDDINVFSDGQKASEFFLGIYDERADRARGHNEGTGHLPQREFFALNGHDYELMRAAQIRRIRARAGAQTRR